MAAHLVPLGENEDEITYLHTRQSYTFARTLEGLGDFTICSKGSPDHFELELVDPKSEDRDSPKDAIDTKNVMLGAFSDTQSFGAAAAVYVNGARVAVDGLQRAAIDLSDGDRITIGGPVSTAGFSFHLGTPELQLRALTQHTMAFGSLALTLLLGGLILQGPELTKERLDGRAKLHDVNLLRGRLGLSTLRANWLHTDGPIVSAASLAMDGRLDVLAESADGEAAPCMPEAEVQALMEEFDHTQSEIVATGLHVVDYRSLYWSFPGALFYSFTVITTIGYGVFVPHTAEGKLATVVLGLLGNVLCGLCLELWVNELNGAFEHAVSCCAPRSASSRVLAKMGCATLCTLGYMLLLAAYATWASGFDLLEAFYFSFQSMATVGLGDYALVPDFGREELALV